MNNTIKQLFEQVAELTGYPTEGIRNKKGSKNFYKKNFLSMSHAPIYGGYRLEITLKNTGVADFDGLTRKSKKEMESYLRGLIKGLTIKNDKRIK